jgi:hypothetical protein
MLTDVSVGLYSRDALDMGHEVDGVSRLVVAEIKKVGVTIGSEQKAQAWRYVTELIKKGLITEAARVTCFVLGSKVEQTENSDTTHWDGRVTIRPMSYDVVIRSRGEEDARPKGQNPRCAILRGQNIDVAAFH